MANPLPAIAKNCPCKAQLQMIVPKKKIFRDSHLCPASPQFHLSNPSISLRQSSKDRRLTLTASCVRGQQQIRTSTTGHPVCRRLFGDSECVPPSPNNHLYFWRVRAHKRATSPGFFLVGCSSPVVLCGHWGIILKTLQPMNALLIHQTDSSN